jgi:hypothetical protein
MLIVNKDVIVVKTFSPGSRQMQAACADSARAYDWSHYSRRSLDIFSSLLGSGIGGRQ